MNTNWQSVVVDLAVLAAVVVLSIYKIVPSEIAIATVSALVAARAALMRPPPGPGGGASAVLGASGLGAPLLGIAALLHLRH